MILYNNNKHQSVWQDSIIIFGNNEERLIPYLFFDFSHKSFQISNFFFHKWLVILIYSTVYIRKLLPIEEDTVNLILYASNFTYFVQLTTILLKNYNSLLDPAMFNAEFWKIVRYFFNLFRIRKSFNVFFVNITNWVSLFDLLINTNRIIVFL